MYLDRSEMLDPPEPKRVYRCKECGGDICEGEEFVEVNGDFYHKECFEDMGLDEMLRLLDARVQVAELEGA